MECGPAEKSVPRVAFSMHPSTSPILQVTACSVSALTVLLAVEEQFLNKKDKNPKLLALHASFGCDLASKIIVDHIRLHLQFVQCSRCFSVVCLLTIAFPSFPFFFFCQS